MHRWRIAIAILSTVTTFTLAAATGAPDASAGEPLAIAGAQGGSRGYDDHQPFGIAMRSRTPEGLHPGVTRKMELTLQNPYDFALRVKSLRGEVVASSKRRCQPVAANLLARGYTGELPIVIPPRGKVNAKSIPLFMPSGASQACAGATFIIRLSGTAAKAYR